MTATRRCPWRLPRTCSTAIIPATAGSCFAQHIAANFRARGFRVIDKERAKLAEAEAALAKLVEQREKIAKL